MASNKPAYSVLCHPRNTALVALCQAIELRLAVLAAAAPSKQAAKSSAPFGFKVLHRAGQAAEQASVTVDDRGNRSRVIGETHALRLLGRVLLPQLYPAPVNQVQDEAKEKDAACSSSCDDSLAAVYFADGSVEQPEAAILQGQVDFFLQFADSVVGTSYTPVANAAGASDLCGAIAEQLNTHLACRAFLVGSGVTLADYAVLGALVRHPQWAKLRKNPEFPHIRRWSLSLGRRPEVDFALLELDPKLKEQRAKEAAKREKAAVAASAAGAAENYALDLPNVEAGVVTRFPPEPSGYLHIGHAKALLLNFFFKERYGGKMLMRFDDTNPTKEKDEYAQAIVEDIRTLGVEWDGAITHTSDYFPQLLEIATRFIQAGVAYVDDTPKEQLRAWRLECVESPGRSRSVAENMALWKEMQAGSELGQKCVLRLKMDMKNANGCLRDPVAYRCNLTPHHRTGDKYKLYPTYDFACPIVDSIEGVTHVLRTIEYKDRDAQFDWMMDLWDQAEGGAKHFRSNVWGYSRLNFIRTTLSKRHLTWFVNNGRVTGWDDPRMPTVRGILRRGMQVPALRQFMIEQGASRAVNMMHWDKIWATNRAYLDPIAHRYMAVYVPGDDRVTGADLCLLELEEGLADEIVETPVLPKDRQGAQKKVLRSRRLFIEPDDAKALAVGEEITLMNWGNVVIRNIELDAASGVVRRVHATSKFDGDFKSTKQKIAWVAAEKPVPVTVFEFDHLLRVDKLDDAPSFEEAVNEVTQYESAFWGERALADVKEHQVIQLMRRGFYRCDRPYDPATGAPMVLFSVPDGHVAGSMSTLSTKLVLTGF